MKSRILAFAGSKQAGKSTCANFLHGYQLRAHNVISDFGIIEDGSLAISTNVINAEGEPEKANAILDISRTDFEFADWAEFNMWPYVKSYSFASPLKQICTELFELGTDQAYGSDNKKNSATIFRWEEMPGVITDKNLAKQKDVKRLIEDGTLQYHKSGRMSAREFLQFFGTDICRAMYEDIWQANLVKNISAEQPLLAIVDDCRFPNEAEAISGASGKVIKLTRDPYDDKHTSECALSSYKNFDAVIDNKNMSIQETNIKIIDLLNEWGWLGAELIPEVPQEEKPAEPQLAGGIHKFKEEN